MRGMRHLASDLDYRDGNKREYWDVRPLTEILNEHKDRIPIGSPGDVIDDLSGSQRQLLEASEYFSGSWGIFKKITREDNLERYIDFSKFPEKIRSTIELLDIFEVDDSSLRQAILKAEGDDEAIEWIENNIDLFLDPSMIHSSEVYGVDDVYSPTWNPSEVKLSKSFRPPKDSYKLVEKPWVNKYREASERRKNHFKVTLDDIARLQTIDEVIKFSNRIFASYEEDKTLRSQWTPEQKRKDKDLYVKFLRARGLDLETIRGKVWWCFEMEQSKVIDETENAHPLIKGWTEHFGSPDSSLVKDESRVEVVPLSFKQTGRCQWDTEKSNEFCSLNQTGTQWQGIWSALWDRLGRVLIQETKVATSEAKRNRIRRYLGKYQNRISKEHFDEVIDLLIEREKEA